MYKISRPNIYFILLAAFFIHVTVLHYFRIFGAQPDLALICVIFFGLFLGGSAGLEAGIAAGLLEDLFALDYFGINTLILGATGLAAGALSTKFARESKMTQGLLVLALTAGSMAIHFALASSFSRSLGLVWGEFFMRSAVPAGVYTALVSIPIFSHFINAYHLRDKEDFL